MIRKATWLDLDAVEQLYNEIHDAEEAGLITTGWLRGVYPSRESARAALERDDLFMLEEDGKILGSGIINQIQVDVYEGAPWEFNVPDQQVCVLHTLVISPAEFGKGYARAFLTFYEEYAREHRCSELRIDTNARNAAARAMYKNTGTRRSALSRPSSTASPALTWSCWKNIWTFKFVLGMPCIISLSAGEQQLLTDTDQAGFYLQLFPAEMVRNIDFLHPIFPPSGRCQTDRAPSFS